MAKVMVGARAKVLVDGIIVGIFDSCSYSVNVGAEPIHLLGRFGPAEITPTSYEAVSVNCSGFRLIGNGAHRLPKFPKLQDLLDLDTVTLELVDRQSSGSIMKVFGCIPVNYATGYNARSTSRIQISYLGIKHSDEEGDQSEGDAVELP